MTENVNAVASSGPSTEGPLVGSDMAVSNPREVDAPAVGGNTVENVNVGPSSDSSATDAQLGEIRQMFVSGPTAATESEDSESEDGDPGPVPGESEEAAPSDTPGWQDVVLTEFPLFRLGQLVATPGAIDAIAGTKGNPLDYVRRHVCGDWGNLDAEDVASNWLALKEGTRLLSSYVLPGDGVMIWLITEADRSVTTLLLPSDY